MIREDEWSKFDGKFWKPEQGKQYTVVLSNWRVEERVFDKQENNPKPMLVFDVLRVDDREFAASPKEWGTSSYSAVNEFKPLCKKAEEAGKQAIRVIIKRDAENKYTILEIPPSVEYI